MFIISLLVLVSSTYDCSMNEKINAGGTDMNDFNFLMPALSENYQFLFLF